MSLLGVIARFATPSRAARYKVTRRAAATYDANGREVDGAATTYRVQAVVVSRAQVSQLRVELPGQRTEEDRVLATAFALRTRTTATEPDEVEIDGEAWVVDGVARAEFFGDVFYVAAIARASAIARPA